MELFYRDIKDMHEQWNYLEVIVKGEGKPTMPLISGGKRRLKIDSPFGTIGWANVEEGSYGAWFLRNDNVWTLEQMPVPPIHSQDVENAIVYSGEDRDGYWARFFAKALGRSKVSPLYPGIWRLVKNRQYIERGSDLPGEEQTPENLVGFYHTRPIYLDWGAAGNYGVYTLKALPDEQDGRVKWWRKKVRLGECPPVLIWFISGLQAYVVLDGHSRLRACQLEDSTPDYIVLKSVIEADTDYYKLAADRIYKSFAHREDNTRKPPLTVDEMNNILLQVYNPYALEEYTSRSLAIHGFEELWLKEVRAFVGKEGTDEEELDCMIYD